MYELKKKIGKVFTSKFGGTGPSSCGNRIYRAAVSQRFRNAAVMYRVHLHHMPEWRFKDGQPAFLLLFYKSARRPAAHHFFFPSLI